MSQSKRTFQENMVVVDGNLILSTTGVDREEFPTEAGTAADPGLSVFVRSSENTGEVLTDANGNPIRTILYE